MPKWRCAMHDGRKDVKGKARRGKGKKGRLNGTKFVLEKIVCAMRAKSEPIRVSRERHTIRAGSVPRKG